MTNKISLANGVCLCVAFVSANHIIYNTNNILAQNYCISLILSFALGIALFAIYSSILSNCPKLDLFALINQIFSPFFAKVILSSYLGFAIICGGYCLRSLIDFCFFFLQGAVPFVILSIIFILLCIYTAEKGVTPVAKFSIVGVIISVGLIVFSLLLGVKDFDFSNLSLQLPSVNSIMQSSIKTTLAYFGEAVILMGVLRCHSKYSKAFKLFVWGGFIGMLILALTHLRNLLILGQGSLESSQFPSYSALSVIGIFDFLSNLELFALIVYVILCFIKVCVCLISAKNTMCKILNKNSGKKYVLPIGIAVLILSFILPKVQFDSAYLALCFVLSLIIPLFILFVIKLQKKTAG